MSEASEMRAMIAVVTKNVTDTNCGPLSPVDEALIGVLATLMKHHVDLYRKVAELERRVKG